MFSRIGGGKYVKRTLWEDQLFFILSTRTENEITKNSSSSLECKKVTESVKKRKKAQEKEKFKSSKLSVPSIDFYLEVTGLDGYYSK